MTKTVVTHRGDAIRKLDAYQRLEEEHQAINDNERGMFATIFDTLLRRNARQVQEREAQAAATDLVDSLPGSGRIKGVKKERLGGIEITRG
jgi:hypothetical protein